MQLHRLALRAIGPFAGEHEVDFDRLGASGLFLLEGPTGAGKSTIIDAVVFALYGRVAGSGTSEDRMHSDFAAPEVEPFVELDFSTSSGIYRIRRTPKHDRPKLRGSGRTTQNATARLWRMVSPDAGYDSEPVANRIEEVAGEVGRIVGLTRDQFVQTVVLPQGEFASFLRADAETRRALLQRLFGTEVYDRVVRHLEDQRKSARQARAAADAQVTGAVRAFCGAAGVAADDEASLGGLLGTDADLTEALQQQVSALTRGVVAATEQRAAAEEAATQAARVLVAARTLEERRVRKAGLLAEQTQLVAQEDDHRAGRSRLAAASRAARVRPLLAGVEQAAERREAAAARLAASRAGLPHALATAPEEDWAGEEGRLRDLAGSLRPVAEVEKDLPARDAEVARLRADHASLLERQAALAAAVAALPERIEVLRQRGREAVALAGTVAAASAARLLAQQRLAATRRRVDLAEAVAKARAQWETAQELARTAQDDEDRLRRAYLDGIAGQLSVELVDGAPCPVCGSTAHPRPAGRAPDAVVRADVERAADRRTDAQGVREAAADELGALAEQLAAASAVAGDLSVDDAVTEVAEAEEAAAAAVQARSDAERLRADEQAAEADLERQLLAATHLGGDLARVSGELTRAVADVSAQRTTVEAAAAGFPSVSERVASVLDRADAVAAACRAADELGVATRDLAARTGELEAAAAAEGFADGEAAARAHLPSAELADLERRVAQFDERRSSVRTLLAAPELAQVSVDDVGEIEPLAAAAERGRLDLEAAQSQLAGRSLRLADARGRLADVESALDHRREVAGATRPVIRMADLAAAASADNAKAMTLPTFVLLERFGEVVAAANERLSVMSDGRYALEHSEERQGGRRSGLGLLVRDTHTDQPRDPRTLSGGETFYCSLALALGLADVVTAESGGIDLGSLFVDEGFGALDQDTLEQVLGVLSGLGRGGRVVGIVSHVPELTERISERVAVRRLADGSSRLEVHA